MIQINKSKTADTRTAEGFVTKKELYESTVQHVQDVSSAMSFFAQELLARASVHDYTKLQPEFFMQYFHAFHKWQTEGFDAQDDWYDMHVTTERHHLNNHVPDDVTLIDILERISDISMAGMGRSGSVWMDKLPDEVLQKAYENTISLLVSKINVSEVE